MLLADVFSKQDVYNCQCFAAYWYAVSVVLIELCLIVLDCVLNIRREDGCSKWVAAAGACTLLGDDQSTDNQFQGTAREGNVGLKV